MSYLKDSTGRIQLALILCVLFNSFIASAFAAEKLDDAIDDPFFINDVPIVLSATRLAQPQTEAPAAVTIIDRELIKLSGAKNIAEIFRLVPGMHVGYFRGNRAVVAYQGLSSEYPQGVQVLIDGRSVYSPLFGGVDWSNIPLVMEDIERIEVIRGPNGSSFGSNAFQSVINITTSHAVQLNGLQLKTTVGERGYQRTLLRGSDSIGDLDYRISASHIDNNGYHDNDDDSRQDLFSARVDYQLTPKDSLQLNFGAVNTLNQTRNPDNSEIDPFDPLRQVDESNYSLHGKWEHSTNDRQHFTTQASYTRHLSKDKVSSVFEADGLGDVAFNGNYSVYYDRYDLEFEHQLQPSDQLRVSWGLGSRNDRVRQPIWMGSEKKFDNSIQRVFSNVEWRPSSSFIVNAGALWEHSQLSGDNLSPRLAVNYLLTPEHSFRLIRSHAIRAPVLAEENFNADIVLETVPPGAVLTIPFLRSEGGLDPETVDSYELGYHGLFINNTLTLDLKLFRNEYDNLIDSSDVETPRFLSIGGGAPIAIEDDDKYKLFSNLRYANVNGYEIELNYRPDKKNLLHVGYAYNHTDIGKLSNNDIRNILSSVPDDVFNILASHTFDNNIWLSSAFYYTGSMEYLDSGNPQGPMRRLDINAGKSFKVAAKQSLDISVGLQLALDKNKDFLKQFNLDNRAFIEASYTFE
ncbi:MAG: TonB-dependent receptor [Cycloclasticus sp.]|nr:TonB-dependent receptor [Cycloclasticus sp.]